MGRPNNALSVYMNQSDRIGSVLEYYMEEKLPEDWSCEEIRGQYSVWESGQSAEGARSDCDGRYPDQNGGGRLSFRQRDYLGKAHAWGTDFLLGIENQQKINLIFPWRLMELDYLTYRQKIEENQAENERRKVRYDRDDDFLYRYRKEDRVELVLNLVLYWGKEKWETPLTLREMAGDVSKLPDKLLRLAGDYKTNVIHMRKIPEDAINRMDSDLKYVLGMMKHADSPEACSRYIQENRDYFSRIPRSAFDVIDACVNVRGIRKELQFTANQETREEEADMCKALVGIERNAERRGKQEGIQQVCALMKRLLAEGRQEEIMKAAEDDTYLQKLLLECN
ncbi:MAG: Rpn family recombination-promoting nuclease/putative transposase [Roseburia sp.]|nr:Rpn family recombination-promoting nuclease/putative transposase [Roseburia sp.]MCM1098616.1 Rpn family recombination-promoting nuclease/putative transposase [Ruminococcus flavefaciens]